MDNSAVSIVSGYRGRYGRDGCTMEEQRSRFGISAIDISSNDGGGGGEDEIHSMLLEN
jgi:hypothetical protein